MLGILPFISLNLSKLSFSQIVISKNIYSLVSPPLSPDSFLLVVFPVLLNRLEGQGCRGLLGILFLLATTSKTSFFANYNFKTVYHISSPSPPNIFHPTASAHVTGLSGGLETQQITLKFFCKLHAMYFCVGYLWAFQSY